MSQIGVIVNPALIVETLTGNVGGAVGAFDNNINIVGAGIITVTGNPGTNTLTITGGAAVATSFTTDAGVAVPALDNLNVFGTANQIHTAGAGSTITFTIPATFIAPGSISSTTSLTAGNSFTVTAGAITFTPFNAAGMVINSALGVIASAATTRYAVQVGNATGQISSLALGTAGQVLTSNGAGANPSFQNIGAANYTAIAFVNSPYAVLPADEYISVNPAGGAITINFPNAPADVGTTWTVKDRTGNAFVNNITLTTPGGAVTFDGAVTYVMNVNYQAINLLWNGLSYEVY